MARIPTLYERTPAYVPTTGFPPPCDRCSIRLSSLLRPSFSKETPKLFARAFYPAREGGRILRAVSMRHSRSRPGTPQFPLFGYIYEPSDTASLMPRQPHYRPSPYIISLLCLAGMLTSLPPTRHYLLSSFPASGNYLPLSPAVLEQFLQAICIAFSVCLA